MRSLTHADFWRKSKLVYFSCCWTKNSKSKKRLNIRLLNYTIVTWAQLHESAGFRNLWSILAARYLPFVDRIPGDWLIWGRESFFLRSVSNQCSVDLITVFVCIDRLRDDRDDLRFCGIFPESIVGEAGKSSSISFRKNSLWKAGWMSQMDTVQ